MDRETIMGIIILGPFILGFWAAALALAYKLMRDAYHGDL